MFVGIDSGLGAIGKVEFAEDIAHVCFNCLFANGQGRGYLAIALSLSNEGKYLQFARSKVAVCGDCICLRDRGPLNELFHDVGMQLHFPFVNGANGLVQRGWIDVLQ